MLQVEKHLSREIFRVNRQLLCGYSDKVLAARRPLNSNTTPPTNNNGDDQYWWYEGYSGNENQREKGAAVAGELACLAGYMAGYLKAAGAACAPTGSPQYHPHGHPGMPVGPHPHPGQSHPHASAHPGLPSPFALAHPHPHGHPLDHGLGAFQQGKCFIFLFFDFF